MAWLRLALSGFWVHSGRGTTASMVKAMLLQELTQLLPSLFLAPVSLTLPLRILQHVQRIAILLSAHAVSRQILSDRGNWYPKSSCRHSPGISFSR